MMGSLGEKHSTDPFIDGFKTTPNLQTISSSVGARRKAGMICDNATSAHGRQVRPEDVFASPVILLISSCENLNPLRLVGSAQLISIRQRHTDMQDRGPPINVILKDLVSDESHRREDLFHSRISIYALDIRDAFRKRCQPTLWFPFRRIGPPNRWVAVQIENMGVHVCVFRYKYFMD